MWRFELCASHVPVVASTCLCRHLHLTPVSRVGLGVVLLSHRYLSKDSTKEGTDLTQFLPLLMPTISVARRRHRHLRSDPQAHLDTPCQQQCVQPSWCLSSPGGGCCCCCCRSSPALQVGHATWARSCSGRICWPGCSGRGWGCHFWRPHHCGKSCGGPGPSGCSLGRGRQLAVRGARHRARRQGSPPCPPQLVRVRGHRLSCQEEGRSGFGGRC